MELSVENICGLLIRSRLLTVDEVKALYQRWLSESAGDKGADLGQFTQWLVRNRYLTDYQANLLARGHADSFFLNDYKILERLGRGRMAGVYKAVHKLGQVVAIKVLPPSRAKDAHALARFQREAELAVRLNHPNVVRAYQTGAVGSLHYIVMEYLEGETLDELLQRRGRLPPDEAVRIAHQVLLGLQHVHEQEIVHRDLKPANLFLANGSAPDQPPTVKILDVGLAKGLFDESGSFDRVNLTGEGVLLGTPDYLAPEQARNAQKADIRADIYSLGCVLYHMLTGQPPFPDTHVLNQVVRHASETAKPLRDFNPDVPDGLQQIVSWMMAKDPAQRYPTPARAAQALEVFLVAATGPPTLSGDDPTMSSYLSWLKEHGQDVPAAAAVPTEPVPVVALAPPESAADVVTLPPDGPRSERRPPEPKPRGRVTGEMPRPVLRSTPAPVPQAVPAVLEEAVNVELVGLPPPPPPAEVPRGFRLERRDFIFFIIGAASVIAAEIVGFLIQRLVSWLQH